MRGLTPQEVTDLTHMAGPHAGTIIDYETEATAEVMDGLLAAGRASVVVERDEIGIIRHWTITEEGRRALALWCRLTAGGVLP